MDFQLHSLPQAQAQNPAQGAPASVVPSEIPAAPTRLSAREKRIWAHVTEALHECGLVHRTDALTLAVITRTFARWEAAEKELDGYIKEHGSYIVATPNGYQQPHQLFYVARGLKKDLLQWLPEAALTIPAFAKAMEAKPAAQQGTLFDDPIERYHQRRPTGLRAV